MKEVLITIGVLLSVILIGYIFVHGNGEIGTYKNASLYTTSISTLQMRKALIVEKKNEDGTYDFYSWDGKDKFERLSSLKLRKIVPAVASKDRKKIAFVLDGTKLYVFDVERKTHEIIKEDKGFCCLNWGYDNKWLIYTEREGCNNTAHFLNMDTKKVEFKIKPETIDKAKHVFYNIIEYQPKKFVAALQIGCWSPTLEVYSFELNEKNEPVNIKKLTNNSYYENVFIVFSDLIWGKGSQAKRGYNSPENAFTLKLDGSNYKWVTTFKDMHVTPLAEDGKYIYIWTFRDRKPRLYEIYIYDPETKEVRKVVDKIDDWMLLKQY